MNAKISKELAVVGASIGEVGGKAGASGLAGVLAGLKRGGKANRGGRLEISLASSSEIKEATAKKLGIHSDSANPLLSAALIGVYE